MAEIILREFVYVDIHFEKEESVELYFTVDSDMDFSGTKPDEISFVGEHTKVTSWLDLLNKTINTAYDLDSSCFIELAKKNCKR